MIRWNIHLYITYVYIYMYVYMYVYIIRRGNDCRLDIYICRCTYVCIDVHK